MAKGLLSPTWVREQESQEKGVERTGRKRRYQKKEGRTDLGKGKKRDVEIERRKEVERGRERERSREEKRRRLCELAAILAGTKHDMNEGRVDGGMGV